MRLSLPLRSRECRPSRDGFTLIEIMVVVAIGLIVMGMTIPTIIRKVHVDSIQKAVNDLVDACREARTRAILQGSTVELHIAPGTRDISVVMVREAPSALAGNLGGDEPNEMAVDGAEVTQAASAAYGAPIFRRHLSERIFIELLDVNFYEWKDAELARVRFFANGTCDEFTMVLRSAANEWRKVSLEVVTSLSEIETDPNKFAR